MVVLRPGVQGVDSLRLGTAVSCCVHLDMLRIARIDAEDCFPHFIELSCMMCRRMIAQAVRDTKAVYTMRAARNCLTSLRY